MGALKSLRDRKSVGTLRPRRAWVIERTLAWLNRWQRLSKDSRKQIDKREAVGYSLTSIACFSGLARAENDGH